MREKVPAHWQAFEGMMTAVDFGVAWEDMNFFEGLLSKRLEDFLSNLLRLLSATRFDVVHVVFCNLVLF